MSEQPPPPLALRSKVLFGILGALVVAIVIAAMALSSVLGSGPTNPLGSARVDDSGAQLSDCGEIFPDGFSERASADLLSRYSENLTDALAPTGIPDGFPAAAFAWSRIVPVCGSAIMVDDETYGYLFYAEDVSRSQFDGLASMLIAAGTIMTADDVPREPQGVAPGEFSGAVVGTGTQLLREFVIPDVGSIQVGFQTDDLVSTSGTGELVIEFTPGS